MKMVAASSDNTMVGGESNRTFLVVVDDTEELANVLSYACNRARFTGGKVALLFVIDTESSPFFQHWQFVGDLMEEETMEAAKQTLSRHAAQITKKLGSTPTQYIRKGKTRKELFALIKEQPGISNLLLGSATGEKPGSLVEAVTGKYAGQIGIPVTIIPGSLSLNEIDSLT